MNEREKAIAEILTAIRSPIYLMSRPSRTKVMALADEHQITAKDLLDFVATRAVRA
jgi:hypothetical protein